MSKFESIIANATLADAQAWQATDEPTLFVLDFLDASIRHLDNGLQDACEDRFEELLAAAQS